MMKYLLFVFFVLQALIASATAEEAERASEEASYNRALIITDFLYTYNVTRAILRPGAAIPFSTNGPIVGGLTHIEGDTAIFVANAGFYKINFSIFGSGIDTFAVFINDVIDEGTIYSAMANQIIGQAIVAIPPNSTISIRNISRNAVILQSSIRFPITINASLTVELYL